MARRSMSAFNLAALHIGCTRCGAIPQQWCRTVSGNRATYLHMDRTEPIRLGWELGWDEGRLDQHQIFKGALLSALNNSPDRRIGVPEITPVLTYAARWLT